MFVRMMIAQPHTEEVVVVRLLAILGLDLE